MTTFHALSIPRMFFRACRDQSALSYPALLFWSCICRRGRLRGRTHETQHFGVFLLYPRRCLFSLVSEMITSLRWPMASKSFIFCVFFFPSPVVWQDTLGSQFLPGGCPSTASPLLALIFGCCVFSFFPCFSKATECCGWATVISRLGLVSAQVA